VLFCILVKISPMKNLIEANLKNFDKNDFVEYNKAYILVVFNYVSIVLLFITFVRSFINYETSSNSILLSFLLPGIVLSIYIIDLILLRYSSKVQIPGNLLILSFLFIFLGVSFFLVEDIGVRLYFGIFFYLVAIFSMSYLVSGKWVVFLNLFILLVGINILYNKIVAVESSPAILRLAKIGLINIHIVLIGLSIVITLTRSITSKFMEKILFSKERQKKFNNLLSKIILNVEKTSLQINELTSQMELISMKVKDSSAIQAASLEEISATIEELTNSVDETAHIAKEANDSVDLSIQMIESNEQNFRQTTEEILRTREESYKIEEISGKTEILAINASIEISRSTNQGFSNIAHEIRKLAEITLKTATDIFQLSDQAFGYSENSGTNLIQIKQVVSYLDTQISAIYMGVLEQKTAFESISRGIIEISESSQLNAAVSEKLTESLSELKRNSNELKSLFN
jgi:hypothetical protein